MNTHQRITQLETKLQPSRDTREPLLVTFLDSDPATGKVIDDSGILYVYHGDRAGTYELDRQQVASYKAKGDLPTTVGLDKAYKREPNFRIDNSKTERGERVKLWNYSNVYIGLNSTRAKH